MTDFGIVGLAKGCTELTSLSVDTCSGISDESVVELARRCTRLDSFQANGCSGLSDDSLVALAMGEQQSSLLLNFTAGGFIYVATVDVLPALLQVHLHLHLHIHIHTYYHES